MPLVVDVLSQFTLLLTDHDVFDVTTTTGELAAPDPGGFHGLIDTDRDDALCVTVIWLLL